jgi:hypothetical protein
MFLCCQQPADLSCDQQALPFGQEMQSFSGGGLENRIRNRFTLFGYLILTSWLETFKTDQSGYYIRKAFLKRLRKWSLVALLRRCSNNPTFQNLLDLCDEIEPETTVLDEYLISVFLAMFYIIVRIACNSLATGKHSFPYEESVL